MLLIIKKSTGQTYENNSSNDKPNPTKVIVPETKELYEKIVTCKLSSDANIRVGFSNDAEIYKGEITKTDTLLQIEPSQSQTVGSHTRVAVVKIDGEDVSEQGYTVIDSVFKDMRIDFLAKERYSNKKVFALKEITKERCTNNEE
jgi:hypothetical protein